MQNHVIVGVHLTNRVKNATDVQKVLTEFGCNIMTRVGLHDVADGRCSPNGLILLQIFGGESVADSLISKMKAISGVEAQKMVF